MKRNKKRLCLYGILTLAVMGMIFFMSAKDATESGSMSKWLVNTSFGRMLIRLLPRLTDRGDEIDLRKYAHMAEYALLAVPSVLFFRELLLEKHVPVRASFCSLVFCFVYACSDEYHQTFVPGRAGAMIDVAVDLVGVSLGLALVLLVCIACMRRKELK